MNIEEWSWKVVLDEDTEDEYYAEFEYEFDDPDIDLLHEKTVELIKEKFELNGVYDVCHVYDEPYDMHRIIAQFFLEDIDNRKDAEEAAAILGSQVKTIIESVVHD